MNTNILKTSAITGISLIALGHGGTAWAAGCIDANPLYPKTSTTFIELDDPSTYVVPSVLIPEPSITEFDGNLTCDSTSGYFGGYIAGGSGTKTFWSGDGSVQFTVKSYLDNGKAVWRVILDDYPEDGVTELRGIDATISAGNKGSKGCNTTFGVDAGFGESAFEKNNGDLVASDLFVCANKTVDPVPVTVPPPPPAVVKECFLNNGDTTTIYGVTILCEGVPDGEQRTIFVAKDTENDDDHIAQPVPGFGFTNAAGVIDFNNVCICNGPENSGYVKETCDPSTLPGDPEDDLPLCTVNNALPPLDITIQNPRCVTYGGSRRCY